MFDLKKVINDPNFITDPVVFSRGNLKKLLPKKHAAELAVYVYVLTCRENVKIPGGSLELADFSIPKMSEHTGYGRSKIYSALSTLMDLNIIAKITVTNHDGDHPYLSMVYEIEPGELRTSGLNNPTVDGLCSSDKEPWIPVHHSGFQSMDSSPRTTPPTANSLSNKDLRPPNGSKNRSLYEENTKYSTNTIPRSERSVNYEGLIKPNEAIRNVNPNETIRKDIRSTKRKLNVTSLNYREQTLFDLPPKIEISREEEEILEDMKRIEYGFSSQPELLARYLKPLQKRLKAIRRRLKQKGVSGYHSKDFVPPTPLSGPNRGIGAPKDFIAYYMANVFKRRNVEYYIPKSNYGKYIVRSRDIIEELGEGERVQLYIDWFLREDRFAKTGFSLDLLISSSVLNQFRSADPSETRVGLSRGFVSGVEEAKAAANKARRI